MRICFTGAYKPHYARHAILLEGLKAHGIEVIERPLQTPRTLQRAQELARVIAELPPCDAVILAAFNGLLAPFAWAICKSHALPLWIDYMVGLSDVQADRQTVHWIKRRLYQGLDKLNALTINSFTDTALHKAHFEHSFACALPRMQILPVGVRSLPLLPASDAIVVQYVGTFIPFHSVETILYAAQILPQITFELIGSGQTFPAMFALAQQLKLDNVRFVKGYFDTETLLQYQARSTLQLGVFGDSPKTRYVVPNKIFEALALGKPIITAHSPALAEQLDLSIMLLVPPQDPQALAQAIQTALSQPNYLAQLAQDGREYVMAHYSSWHIGQRLKTLLEHGV